MTASTAPFKLETLNALRAIAAGVVFLRHALNLLGPEPTERGAIFGAAQGATGVSLFFVLSGFVLAWSRSPSDSTSRFYRRRFARIYPAYVVSLALGIGLMMLDGGRVDPIALAFALTLTQDWVPDPDIYYAINPVSWSLSCEAAFYLLFPFAARRCEQASPLARRRCLQLLVGLAILIPLVVRPPGATSLLVHLRLSRRPTARVPDRLASGSRNAECPFSWSPPVDGVDRDTGRVSPRRHRPDPRDVGCRHPRSLHVVGRSRRPP